MSESPSAEEVAVVLDLFRAGEGAALFGDKGFEMDLRVTLRVTLLTGHTLEYVKYDPVASFSELDDLRDDLTSALEFFQRVNSTVRCLRGVPISSWSWQFAVDWHSFCSHYHDGLVVLRASQTTLQDRYGVLTRLTRQQLILWAQMFGMGPR